MTTYEIYVSPIDSNESITRHNENGSVTSIPKDPANSDYQTYLKSLES
jgi:hypothetical protein